MAKVIIGGQMLSLVLALLVTPVFYALLDMWVNFTRRIGIRFSVEPTRPRQEMVGAGAWVGRAVGDVPHGVEQLTQLASVCVAGPDIIILDEPATGLSAREVDHLAEILTHLKAQGVTMIIIEHQTRFLFPLCDRVTVLNAGEVILTGTAEEVRAHPVVRQVYLGE